MQVYRIEDTSGSLMELQFVNTGDENFKGQIKDWLKVNFPSMTYQEFFDRLAEYHNNICRVVMT